MNVLVDVVNDPGDFFCVFYVIVNVRNGIILTEIKDKLEDRKVGQGFIPTLLRVKGPWDGLKKLKKLRILNEILKQRQRFFETVLAKKFRGDGKIISADTGCTVGIMKRVWVYSDDISRMNGVIGIMAKNICRSFDTEDKFVVLVPINKIRAFGIAHSTVIWKSRAQYIILYSIHRMPPDLNEFSSVLFNITQR